MVPATSAWAAGASRFSIFPALGHMPMCNEDRSLWITYNGEIYNFAELRRELESKGHRFTSHTDTEVVLRLYEQEGPACVKRLNGMFAFAICDLRGSTPLLFVARDHFRREAVLLFSRRGTLRVRIGRLKLCCRFRGSTPSWMRSLCISI